MHLSDFESILTWFSWFKCWFFLHVLLLMFSITFFYAFWKNQFLFLVDNFHESVLFLLDKLFDFSKLFWPVSIFPLIIIACFLTLQFNLNVLTFRSHFTIFFKFIHFSSNCYVHVSYYFTYFSFSTLLFSSLFYYIIQYFLTYLNIIINTSFFKYFLLASNLYPPI